MTISTLDLRRADPPGSGPKGAGCLGFGARLFSPVLARPRAWQVLDVLIGVTMLGIAVLLAMG